MFMIAKPICRTVVVILLSFISINSIAQSIEQHKTDSVFQLVTVQFNAKNADQLYELTGSRLKRDLIIETFRIYAITSFLLWARSSNHR